MMFSRALLSVLLPVSLGFAQTTGKVPHPAISLPSIQANVSRSVVENAVQVVMLDNIRFDLKLSPQQVQKLEKVFSAQNEELESLFKGNPDEKAVDAVDLAATRKAAAELTVAQQARLRQIGLQLLGVDALRFPEVQKDLALTDQQVELNKASFEAADQASNAYDEALGTQLSALSDPGPSATVVQQNAFHDEQMAVVKKLVPLETARTAASEKTSADVLGRLTALQASKWAELKGRKVSQVIVPPAGKTKPAH